ncbi:MAG: RDD family protein [Planctomycetota bacterium]|jgi:uncharacterized RDD family membrane protein YckC
MTAMETMAARDDAASGAACPNHPDVAEGLVECARCGARFCEDCVVELGGQPHCAQCKAERVRDLEAGVDPDAPPFASLSRRAGSCVIDFCVVVVPYLVLVGIAGVVVSRSLRDRPNDVAAVAFIVSIYAGLFLVNFLYQSLMVESWGQTLGMMALKTKVVTPEGNDVSAGQAWLRDFVMALFFFLGNYNILDGLFACFSKEKKCLHDSVARTRVFDVRP